MKIFGVSAAWGYRGTPWHIYVYSVTTGKAGGAKPDQGTQSAYSQPMAIPLSEPQTLSKRQYIG